MFTKKLSVSVLLFVVASFFILAACNGQQKQSKVQLPTKAAQAIAKAVPGGKIIKVKEEKEIC